MWTQSHSQPAARYEQRELTGRAALATLPAYSISSPYFLAHVSSPGSPRRMLCLSYSPYWKSSFPPPSLCYSQLPIHKPFSLPPTIQSLPIQLKVESTAFRVCQTHTPHIANCCLAERITSQSESVVLPISPHYCLGLGLDITRWMHSAVGPSHQGVVWFTWGSPPGPPLLLLWITHSGA